MVNLYYTAIDHIVSVSGNIYNVGRGAENGLSIMELLTSVFVQLDVELNPKHIDARSHDRKFFVADISPVSQALNWKPAIGSTEGVESALQWLDTSGSFDTSSGER